jgi:GNAT superfamily N-acetyltransferase
MVVRDGNSEDVPWLLEQLREFAAFFGSKHSLFDEEYAREYLPQFIDSSLFLVAESDEGRRSGFLGAYITRHPYNPRIDPILSEAFFWVERSHRGGRAAVMLLDAYIEYGKAIGCKWIGFTLETRSPMHEEHLIKRGFHKQESSYLMELD